MGSISGGKFSVGWAEWLPRDRDCLHDGGGLGGRGPGKGGEKGSGLGDVDELHCCFVCWFSVLSVEMCSG